MIVEVDGKRGLCSKHSHVLVANCADPVGRPKRIFPAALAYFQSASPTVGSSVYNSAELNPASPARSVWVRSCAVEVC